MKTKKIVQFSRTPPKKTYELAEARKRRLRKALVKQKRMSKTAIVLWAYQLTGPYAELTPDETVRLVRQYFGVNLTYKQVYGVRANLRRRKRMTPHDKTAGIIKRTPR